MKATQHDFGDRFGRFFERNGLPRTSGRVLGHLLLCVPAEQTFDEIVAALGTSRSTASVATQWLVKLGFVERFGVPTDRRDRYRMKGEAWTTVLTQDIESAAELRGLAEEGLKLMPNSRRSEAARLREMREFYAFLERSLRPLLAEWQKLRLSSGKRES